MRSRDHGKIYLKLRRQPPEGLQDILVFDVHVVVVETVLVVASHVVKGLPHAFGKTVTQGHVSSRWLHLNPVGGRHNPGGHGGEPDDRGDAKAGSTQQRHLDEVL
jgi:hypothetical protein